MNDQVIKKVSNLIMNIYNKIYDLITSNTVLKSDCNLMIIIMYF